jgi:hypothetical protein
MKMNKQTKKIIAFPLITMSLISFIVFVPYYLGKFMDMWLEGDNYGEDTPPILLQWLMGSLLAVVVIIVLIVVVFVVVITLAKLWSIVDAVIGEDPDDDDSLFPENDDDSLFPEGPIHDDSTTELWTDPSNINIEVIASVRDEVIEEEIVEAREVNSALDGIEI